MSVTEPPPTSLADDHALLIAYLKQHDAACPLCGYNLHNLTSPRCPECGRELKLTVGMSMPYLSAWMALLITTCLSGGIGLLAALSTMKEGWPQWPGHEALLSGIFIYYMLMAPTSACIILFRRKLLRLGRQTQWIAFAISATVCASSMAVFALFS